MGGDQETAAGTARARPAGADDTGDPATSRSRELERLAAELRELSGPAFGYADAWLVGSRLVELGTRDGLPITIGVVLGEQQVFHAALAGTSADNDAWLARKVRTVKRFGTSSLAVATRFEGRSAEQLVAMGLDPAVHALSGGAVPVVVGEVVIGAVGVSGLAAADDHALVVRVLREWLEGRLPHPS